MGDEIKDNAVLDVYFSDEAGTEPITLQEAKDWMRVDGTDDDTLITKLIKANRRRLEKHTNTSFIERVVTARIMNGLGGFYLPYGPVTSVTSVKDEDGDDIDSDNYTLFNTEFQQIDTPYNNIVTVTYNAGLDTLPEDMREDLLQQVAYAYQNRGDERAPKISPLLDLSYSRR